MKFINLKFLSSLQLILISSMALASSLSDVQIGTIQDNLANGSASVYGGFIESRQTKEKVALQCVETSENSCTGFKIFLIPKNAQDPSQWNELNPGYIFSKKDIEKLEASVKSKMKVRVDPKGLHLPVFPLTTIVWMLAEQNRNGGGKDLPIEALYVISVPLDIVTFVPITLLTATSYGIRQGVIAIQSGNIKRAFDALEQEGKIKKLGPKNFETLVENIKKYDPNPILVLP